MGQIGNFHTRKMTNIRRKKVIKPEVRTWFYDHENEDGVMKELFINGETVLKGDWYHDKIDERIEGYLQALKDQKFDVRDTIETKQQIV